MVEVVRMVEEKVEKKEMAQKKKEEGEQERKNEPSAKRCRY